MKRFLIIADRGPIPDADPSDPPVDGWHIRITDTWFNETVKMSAATKVDAIGLVGAWVQSRLDDLAYQTIDTPADLITS